MNKMKYRVWITPWGNDEPYMQYIEDLKLHVYIGNWERGGYKDAVFQQWTGIKNRKNKELYEGDVVEYNPDKTDIQRIGVVEWCDYYNGWVIRDSECYPQSEYGVYSLTAPFLALNDVEIVGNVFENEDLLKNE